MRVLDGTAVTVEVIIEPGFDNEATISSTATAVDCDFELLKDPPDLSERMFQADVAITVLGLTTDELLGLGTPIVGLPQAPDQFPKWDALVDAEATLVLEAGAEVDEIREAVRTLFDDRTERQRLRKRGLDIVDDRTIRICDRIRWLP